MNSVQVRANREVEETIVLEWSAEIATQWSRYENLRGNLQPHNTVFLSMIYGSSVLIHSIFLGQIEIPIGECIGRLTIDDNNIVNFVNNNRTRVNINKPTLKRKKSNFELSEVDQIVIRLDEVKFGNALIKELVVCHY